AGVSCLDAGFVTCSGANVCVKLVRSGSTFTGYRSDDGVTWTPAGSVTLSLNATIYVGLAVTAHTGLNVNTSTFTDVGVQAPAAGGRRAGGKVAAAAPERGHDISRLRSLK